VLSVTLDRLQKLDEKLARVHKRNIILKKDQSQLEMQPVLYGIYQIFPDLASSFEYKNDYFLNKLKNTIYR